VSPGNQSQNIIMTIITSHHQGFAWHYRLGVRAKGYLFDDAGTYRRGEKLLDYFASVDNADSFCNKLREANGCFAVIVETDRELLAAVDSVRSMPLFFAANNRKFVLGDDVYAIQQELAGSSETDPVAREEFLRVGYTVGRSTLDPRVEQIEAGEFFVWNKATDRGSARLYFSHAHGNYTDKCEDVLVEELDQITSRWARRLIDSVEGRTIVIPLSGGYDSRSIVCALKREGYPNVVCYSYGVPASFEHNTARKVAEQLGYPIHVIDYSPPCWETVIRSPCFSEFLRLTFQRCAVPCVQEFPAMELLTRDKVIPTDAVIVPGYCGDLQGGSYVPIEVKNQQTGKLLAEGIERYILRNLFHLRSSQIEPAIERAILDKIQAYTSHFKSDDIDSFCSVFEDWFTRHKVAKFVNNTVRTHEMFGHEWRLPLWDSELIAWWYRMPLRNRLNSSFYHRFLFERLFVPFGVEFKKPRPPTQPAELAKQWLPAMLIPTARALYRCTLRRVRPKRLDIDGFESVISTLLERFPPEWSIRDFAGVNAVNGVVGAWCLIEDY
jgi:asparagine synthase (glutamine-hydrolysing)